MLLFMLSPGPTSENFPGIAARNPIPIRQRVYARFQGKYNMLRVLQTDSPKGDSRAEDTKIQLCVLALPHEANSQAPRFRLALR